MLDTVEKSTFLANAVYKARSTIARDMLKDAVNQGSAIGYWESQKRPLEPFFSQMNVIASANTQNIKIFSIRLYNNGQMSFQPDVTTTPHSFEVNNQTWKLWIENIAEPINSIDEDKEERIYTEFYSK